MQLSGETVILSQNKNTKIAEDIRGNTEKKPLGEPHNCNKKNDG